MTTRKHFKRRVRSRAARTGESYVAALRNIRILPEEHMADIRPTASQIATCSFCDKPNTEVTRLVAGPGVFICNECVELSATLIADTAQTSPEERARLVAERRDRSPEQILAMLPPLGRSLARVESDVAHWIARLREQGTDWAEIADALGMSVEDARGRFDATERP